MNEACLMTPLLQVDRLAKRFADAPARAARRTLAARGRRRQLTHRRPAKAWDWSANRAAASRPWCELLARLLDPTEGRIGFDGEDLAAVPAARFARHAAARGHPDGVPGSDRQPEPALQRARDTIAEPLRLLVGLRDRAQAARVDEVAAQVGLPAELLNRFPHQLSGGQKARVGIARALAVRAAAADPGRADRGAGRLGAGRGAAAAGPICGASWAWPRCSSRTTSTWCGC
jgi:ABC-type antimicrobial peptide transport system ATPase subunit